MKHSKKWAFVGAVLVICLLPVFWGCDSARKATKPSVTVAVADTDISLRRGSLENGVESLPAPQYIALEAGDGTKLVRSFYDAPPMISHAIGEFSEGIEDNECLGCHEEGDEETPGVPPSHKIKTVIRSVTRAESTNGMLHVVKGHAKVEGSINNERFYCTTCHLPQATNLSGLVDNDFKKADPNDPQQDVLDDLNNFEY